MEVKGVAFLARQMMVVQDRGEAAWRAFIKEFAEQEPVFAQTVMPVSRLPVDAFLRLNEALVERLYGGDSRMYWEFGMRSAEYALGKGQLKALFAPGDFRRFLLFTPGIWKGYFTAGELRVKAEANATELHLVGVPRPHLYFEQSVMGFAAGGLTMLGAKNLRHEVLKGFSKGNVEVLYRFHITE
ncbi:MAG: hypothetical protein JXB05_33125 [Myxococcaceae bacterium]|nr:hypothetical protein [Myxococcaceae bacterium]